MALCGTQRPSTLSAHKHHTPSIKVLLPCTKPTLYILYICSSLQGLALSQPTQKQLHSLFSTTVILKPPRSCFQPLPSLLIPAGMLCADEPLLYLCSHGYVCYSLLPSEESQRQFPLNFRGRSPSTNFGATAAKSTPCCNCLATLQSQSAILFSSHGTC